MERLEFITEHSPWYILLCIITGAIYAYLLYSKKSIWSKSVNYILAALRFITVFILCLLLLVPMLKQLKNFIEEPTIAIIIDNSQSIKNNGLITKLKETEQKLTNVGYKIEWNSLTQNNIKLEEITFNENITNLSKPIKTLENNFINRNLNAAILISDGIHNQGFSPEYLQTSTPVFTIGIGDTSTQKDIAIQEVYYNKIVYNGNKFPIKVELKQEGFNNENINISLKKNGNTLQTKQVNTQTKSIHEIEFLTETNAVGKQLYTIEIETINGEITRENNTRDIYIQVIDGKQRVLIYAGAPHPDIKAIKSALSKKDNIETSIYYDGFVNKPDGFFDLIILHQFPSKTNKKSEVLKKFTKENTPMWYFIGNNTDIKEFNTSQNTLEISPKSSKNDVVSGAISSTFSVFTIENENLKSLDKLPPIDVLFADFNFRGKTNHLLFQKVGSITTEKPLLTFIEKGNGVKNAFFIGEGLWRWRLHEFAQHENSDGIDELIQKTVQYITAKKDKRQLRVNPAKEEFFSDENTLIDVEVYNAIYEKIYQKEIKIILNNDSISTEFSFVNDENNSRFNLGRLEKGLYNFTASTEIDGEIIKDEGSFVVKEQYLEKITTKANFELLKNISDNSNGNFFLFDNVDNLIQQLITKEHKPKIVLTDETLEELMHQKWIFFLLIFLISIEWGIRKYQGDY